MENTSIFINKRRVLGINFHKVDGLVLGFIWARIQSDVVFVNKLNICNSILCFDLWALSTMFIKLLDDAACIIFCWKNLFWQGKIEIWFKVMNETTY